MKTKFKKFILEFVSWSSIVMGFLSIIIGGAFVELISDIEQLQWIPLFLCVIFISLGIEGLSRSRRLK